MDKIGIIHIIFGFTALISGLIVILKEKGTRWHRTIGHFYLNSMIGLNLTGLSIINLYGGFGPFHWMALISLFTLILGMIPLFVKKRKKFWLEIHVKFINGSYVGLVAATAAEVTSRIPGLEEYFGIVVGLTSALVIYFGAILINHYMPNSLRKIIIGNGII